MQRGDSWHHHRDVFEKYIVLNDLFYFIIFSLIGEKTSAFLHCCNKGQQQFELRVYVLPDLDENMDDTMLCILLLKFTVRGC